MTARLVTRPQICRQLGISRWTWTRWVKDGKAPAPVNTAGIPRWKRADVDRFEVGLYRGPGKRTYFTKAQHLRAEQTSADRSATAHDERAPRTAAASRQPGDFHVRG